MRYVFVLVCLVFGLQSCDDGDIITVNLSFDGNLDLCEDNTAQYVVYDVQDDPPESLSLVFARNSTTEAYFTTETDPDNPIELTIGGSTSFNYRTYNMVPEFCQVLQDPNLLVNEDYEATGGTVIIETTVIDDDNDGIPNASEDDNLDGDNDYLTNPRDTDGDGLPDYIDQDDDNDNVLTINEDDNNDGDGDPSTNPRDTDGDGTPDYLEEDDDNDGTLTRLEDEDENQNPTNDFLTDEPNQLPRFLEPTATQAFPDAGFRDTQYTRTFTTTFTILNLGIEILSTDVLNFGTYSPDPTIITVEN